MKNNTLLKDSIYINKSINTYKHEIPSSREWTNSVYSYNKDYIKNLPQKDNYLYNLIKTYLHLIPIIKVSTKSKRLRDSLTRNNSKQIFMSKPEIKQNTDKVNIMLYIFDREGKINNKKAFYLNNVLTSIINKMIGKNVKVLPKRRYTRKINLKKRLSNRFDAFYNKHNLSVYKNVTFSRNIIHNIFMYSFLKWALSGFGYNILITKNSNKQKSVYLSITKIIDDTHKYSNHYIFSNNSSKTHSNNITVTNLLKINKILITHLYIICDKDMKKVNLILNYYSNRYLDKFLNKYLRKQQIAMKNIFKLHISKIKLSRIIVGLKLLMQNIYSKRIELNIVNLKYLHLNSDILTEAIGVKLRSKNNNVLAIFKKAMSLVKIPKISTSRTLLNNMNLIDKFRSFDINNIVNNKYINYISYIKNKDTVSVILRSIFPYKSLNFLSKFNNLSISNSLNSLYYRWVTGIRLEGKGRLTRRFTASRSMFKYKYRGSLKNLEHLNISYYRKDTLNSIMIRNQYKSNIQYAFTSNKKRVGVYGIKGWISNN